jgi:2,3-bisphosphoglycerate-independent phosphoglycerate mutase
MTAPQRKALVLIIDGLGDLPVAALGGLTPLEAARTPILDRMASAGRYGLVDPILPGEIPNTDSGVGLLLGLVPGQAGRLKRGPVEAAGAGRPLREGEIAVRANFATLRESAAGMLIMDRRAGRISSGAEELAEVVNGVEVGPELDVGLRAEFRSTDQHRGVLILSGPGLDPGVSDTDPGDGPAPGYLLRCEAKRPEAAATAAAINVFVGEAHRRLRGHAVNRRREAAGKPPANGIITRGAGAWFRLDNILPGLGLRAAVVSGCNTVLGLARLFDFDTLEAPGFTASLDTDLPGKIAAATGALSTHDIVYVHVKGPDLCAHDRLPLAKRDFLERLDAALAPLLSGQAVVALTSDHTTDSNVGAHTADPVPSLLYVPGERAPEPEAAVHFGESACRAGNLPRQRSYQFLEAVLELMGCGPGTRYRR